MYGEEVFAEVSEIITRDDFYDGRHGKIFSAMNALYSAHEPIDEITVTSRLNDSGELQSVGGPHLLAELADIAISPTHVGHYADLVRDKSDARLFIEACSSAADNVYACNGSEQDAIETGQQDIFGVVARTVKVGPQSLQQTMGKTLDDIQAEKLPGLKTGFSDIDNLLISMEPGDLIIIAARPSMGKTALGVQVAKNIAETGNGVLLFSLEMGTDQLNQRLLALQSGVRFENIRRRRLVPRDWDALTRAADHLSTLPLYIDDEAGLHHLQIRSRARKLASREGLGAIVVDYLQLAHGSGESREQEIAQIAGGLKKLAKELKVPVIALSQLNRKVEERTNKIPMLSDLRESGAIEQDADVIIFIYREKVYDKKSTNNTAKIVVAKQRNGPTGMRDLYFREELTKFENFAAEI